MNEEIRKALARIKEDGALFDARLTGGRKSKKNKKDSNQQTIQKKSKKPVGVWSFTEFGIEIIAYTKAEARGTLKKLLKNSGYPLKRLTVGCECFLVRTFLQE